MEKSKRQTSQNTEKAVLQNPHDKQYLKQQIKGMLTFLEAGVDAMQTASCRLI